MAKIVVTADIHARIEDPFFTAHDLFFKWFLDDSGLNEKENTLIDLGDLFHNSRPNPRTIQQVNTFFQNLSIRSVYLQAGNHDYNADRHSWSIDAIPNSPTEDTIVYKIKNPMEIMISNKVRIYFFPFMPRRDIIEWTNGEYRTLKDLYESYRDDSNFDPDFLFYHFPDETQAFGGIANGINLSWFKTGQLVGGDIHIQTNRYIGTPFPTRKDEAGQTGHLLIIDTETKKVEYVEVPQFMDYPVVKYGKDLPESKYPRAYIFEDAPSRGAVYSRYEIEEPSIYHEIKVKEDASKSILTGDSTEGKTVKDFFKELAEKKKIKKAVQEKVAEVL